MKNNIYSKRLLLRALQLKDITPAYEKWLNSLEVTKYLEIRHTPQTYERICEYITSCLKNTVTKRHWGIFEKSSDIHIGSITLNGIHQIYKTADISFIIGYPNAQGKGYATEAVHAVCHYAFTELGLHKLTGGHYASHIESQRIFQKNGFTQECVLREQVINVDEQREDCIRYGLLASEFKKQSKIIS